MTNPYDTYTTPLATRNASEAMLRLWSARHKFNTWRRIWLAAAEAMHEVTKGDPRPLVTREQVEELRAVVERGITDEEIRRAEAYEQDLRHDVMAHVHALGDSCPKARPIIHLGMTSQDVVCNADLLVLRDAAQLISSKAARVVLSLASFAEQWAGLPCLGFTHYQPAQPVTLGHRAGTWAAELAIVVSVRFVRALKGLRGATGTQASYLELLQGASARVDDLEESFIRRLLFHEQQYGPLTDKQHPSYEAMKQYQESFRNNPAESMKIPDRSETLVEHARTMANTPDPSAIRLRRFLTFALTGQTYPRVVDTLVLADLASIAAVLHKIATDIRLLCNRKELDEPFESKQVGSSAMPYKRNPMRCERICGLTRFVMNLVGNAYDTAATQWLERTLDDSSNRRLSLPEAFLALDGALDLMHNVASGLVVHEAMVRRNLMAELPFLATENILMACVKAGGDRQWYHERIRVHAQAAGMRVKQEGLDNDLLQRLRGDPAFHVPQLQHELDWEGLLDPMKYVGRSVEQTERFIREVVEPLREQCGKAIEQLGESEPRV